MPLGAEKPIPVDLTVVAASHRDLRRLIADGMFREDLYYRLCGATLNLPALRLRSDKRYVIERVLQQEAQQVCDSAKLSETAAHWLMTYDWPGNIRQLRNVLRYALALCDDGYIEVDHLPQEVLAERRSADAMMITPKLEQQPSEMLNSDRTAPSPYSQRLLISLRKNHWNVTATALDLGISRATVYRQMKRYNIFSPIHQ